MFFTVDMLVNFRTAIIDDGELIEKPREVAFSYIKGWFVLDLIATVPYELILKVRRGGRGGHGSWLAVDAEALA